MAAPGGAPPPTPCATRWRSATGTWTPRALEITPLLADQVEYHPFLDQDALLRVVRERDLTLTAYSPLARGKVARDRTLTEIGEEHGKSAGRVALRWLIEQPQVTAVPKAASHERRAENFDVFDFELTDADRERIDALQPTTGNGAS